MVVDGYEVAINRRLVGKNALASAVYVNGQIQGKNFVNYVEGKEVLLPDITRRFYRKTTRYLYKAKQRQEADKSLGKGLSLKSGFHKRFIMYTAYWNSSALLKRHLLINNKEIKITEIVGV